MKKIALLLFILFISTYIANAQVLCEPSLPYVITSSNGLKLREGPGVTYKVIIFIPGKSDILACDEKSFEAEFEGVKGNWRRVKFKDKYGYLFDGFITPAGENTLLDGQTGTIDNTPKPGAQRAWIEKFSLKNLTAINTVVEKDYRKLDSVFSLLSKVADMHGYEKLIGRSKPDIDSLFKSGLKPKPVVAKESNEAAINYKLLTEASNYCGDIRALDPGRSWYAVYQEGNLYKMKRAELLIVKSKYSMGSGLEFDIRADGESENAFLISSDKPMNTDWSVYLPNEHFLYNPKILYPGQKTEIYANQPDESLFNINLMALGNVVDFQICPVVKDYKLLAIGEMHDKLITQNLMPNFLYTGDCGIPEIYWFGDLNQDKYPDIIFAAIGEKGAYFVLFMSDIQNTNVLYRKADEWFNKTCE
jgi:hypothetical protein